MELEREMMNDVIEVFQAAVAIGCLVPLTLIALICAAYAFSKELRYAREKLGASGVSAIVAAVVAVCAAMYGGSKAFFVRISFDEGLYDNGSVVTNDLVKIRWTYSGIPAASSVFIDYRETGTTNSWSGLGESVASALAFDATLADATNYEYFVYSTYIPPVPVHTNGVWTGQAYETKSRVGAGAFVIINGRVTEHGRAVAPPSYKRKEEEER